MCSSILEERVARIFMVTEFFEVDGEVSRKGNCIKYLGSLQRFWLFKAMEKEEWMKFAKILAIQGCGKGRGDRSY